MQLQIEGITIDALSVAGFYTCIQFPEYKIAMDLGVAPRSSMNKEYVFISHAHGDHISGVVRHCLSREMLRLAPPKYVIGTEDVANFHAFMEAARKLCRSGMPYEVIPVSPKDYVDVRKDLRVRSYRSIHRVPTQGFTAYKRKQKLRPDLMGAPREYLIHLRENGDNIHVDIEEPLFSYTGDTIIDVFKREEHLKNVPLVITEVSFFDDTVSKEASRERGHIHIDDIVENAELFTQKAVLFMHSSSRFSLSQIEDICRKRLPSDLVQRLHLLPNNAPITGF